MADINYNSLPQKTTASVPGDYVIITDSEDGGLVKIQDATLFKGPQGPQGIQGPAGANGTNGTNGIDGDDGRGITSITLISTVGKVKTYRILYTDSTTFDYVVTDGADGTGAGDVVGPASSTDGEIPLFSGTSGKILKNSSKSIVATIGTDDTTVPTSKAVNDAINTAVTGLLDYRGSYDASTNLYPATGGSGIAGAILKGDFWICSVAGTLGGIAVTPGDLIIALIDTPAQTSTNWDLISHDINYVPENVANKSTNTALGNSDTLYPSQKAVKTYVDTQDALKSDLNIINTDTAVSLYAGDKRKDWSFGIPAFTGAIKIEISGLFGYSMDGRMQVQIKSGATNAITINIDGRWDASTSWSTYNATSDTSINVRFARDGSKVYLIIGEIGTVWQNTRLLIDDVLTNYNVGAPIGFITTTITALTGLTIDATVNAQNKANLAGSITQSFGASTIELGHRTDTTLSRVSAGVIAVEGIPIISAGSTTVGQVPTITGTNTYSWQTPSGGGGVTPLRITIPGEQIADTANYQGIYFYNNSGATRTISDVDIAVGKARAGTGRACAVNLYKSSGTRADGINTNAVNLFTSAIDLGTGYTSLNNTPNTTTVESGKWLSLRITSSAGATNKANDLQVVITYS